MLKWDLLENCPNYFVGIKTDRPLSGRRRRNRLRWVFSSSFLNPSSFFICFFFHNFRLSWVFRENLNRIRMSSSSLLTSHGLCSRDASRSFGLSPLRPATHHRRSVAEILIVASWSHFAMIWDHKKSLDLFCSIEVKWPYLVSCTVQGWQMEIAGSCRDTELSSPNAQPWS